MEGDQVPCQFKNLQLNARASNIIYKNINSKLASEKTNQKLEVHQSDIEQTSSYDRKLAYFIRYHLRDILTSDHRHVWFHIQTKALDYIDDRTQNLKTISDDINVVYSLGSMLSYDTFVGHTEERRLVRISFQKFPKAIKLETNGYSLRMHLKNIDAQILINHATDDNSIQVIFMLRSPPIIAIDQETTNSAGKQLMNKLPSCSDLLVRFFPANTAWKFLRNLPIAGYSRRTSDDSFHINFALFRWKKDSSEVSSMGMPTYSSSEDNYGMKMVWSLGYVFQDKYNKNPLSLNNFKGKNIYDICCKIWRNLKKDHCYNINDASSIETSETHLETSSELKKVAFAIITPNRIEYQPMQMTRSHRGFDLYPPENWLLVHIRNYNGIDYINSLDHEARVRFRNFMIKGISLGKRHFRYFGSSGSQMNDKACWFLSISKEESIESAYKKIGDFSKIHNVSTYIARVGLYLTTLKSNGIILTFIDQSNDERQRRTGNMLSRFVTNVRRLFIKSRNNTIEYRATIISDIERNGFCFTDGCGLISLGLAHRLARDMKISIIPSAFQVRVAGCKGMLSIDPKSKSNDYYIKVRKSMVKFDSEDWTLYVVDHSRPIPLSLNNQIIRLLSDLGISNGTFESIQTRCIDRKEYWHPPAKCYMNALESIDQSVINENKIKHRNAKNFLIRNKIPLPVNEARCLFGIADETNTLREGECFIQYRDLQNYSSNFDRYIVLEGPVLVTKSPCLHPGDIRILQAVRLPMLEDVIHDCIVFSTHGQRPSFNEMGGADLDGDQYWVYWGNELRIEQIVQPLLYSPAKKLNVNKITNDLIVDHVLETFTDSAPGIIANTHSVIADKHPSGTHSEECKECAQLFARAIDARKTGENINLARIMEFKDKYCQTYPAWMMKFDKPPMDPPSKSINEILHQKAQEAWLNEDSYNDIIRFYPVDENSADDTLININETDIEQEQTNDMKAFCCTCICTIIFLGIIAIIVYIHRNGKK